MNNISVYSQNKLDGMLNTAITEANMIRVINRKNPVLITLDTSFIMEPDADRFLKEKVFPYLNGAKIFVEVAILSELHKHAKGSDHTKALAAKKALLFIKLNEDKFQIVGKSTDGGLADRYFLAMISKLIGKYHIVLLTEDKGLVHSAQNMYLSMVCVNHKRSLTIATSGRMQTWYDPTGVPPRKKHGEFKLSNAVVFSETGKEIRLNTTKSIGSGAKSRVFATADGPDRVAKVLHPSVFSDDRSYQEFFERVHALMDLDIDDHGHIVIPEELVFDTNGAPVGYVMNRVNGKTLHALVDQGTLSFVERASIVAQLADVLAYLQENGIVVPDLRLDNIMFDRSKNWLSIIDADGFDIPGAPIEVSNNFLYDPPATGFTGDPTAFRFALISFQILAGKHPFLNPGGTSIRDSINDLRFILTHDRQKIMEYLSDDLSDAYINTFTSTTEKTVSMEKWQEFWSEYLEAVLDAYSASGRHAI